VITNWQKSGRKYTAMPDLSDKLPGFAASWWKWWRNLQSSWRTRQPFLLSQERPENPDWSVLNKGTANGFFVIILSLGWWALGLKHAEVNSTSYGMEDLLNAIEDTTWVLQQMALPCSTSTKRPQSEDDNSDINAKRYIHIFPTLFTLLIICSFTASKFDPTIETAYKYLVSLIISPTTNFNTPHSVYLLCLMQYRGSTVIFSWLPIP